MRILEFQTMIRSEASANRALRQRRWRDGTRCLRCASRQLYRLAEGRYRCARCRYTFGLRTGTWAGQVRVSVRTWLWLVKLFELELTAPSGRGPNRGELSDGAQGVHDDAAGDPGDGTARVAVPAA